MFVTMIIISPSEHITYMFLKPKPQTVVSNLLTTSQLQLPDMHIKTKWVNALI